MRDFLPSEVRRREYVIDVIGEVYERHGFEPLETPAVENIEALMGKYGEEERKRGEVSLKDMRSGGQLTVVRESLAATIKESL